MLPVVLQAKIENYLHEKNFDAPYGILTGGWTNKKGRKYLSVTFGRRRTLDVELQIYSSKFIVARSSLHGYDLLQTEKDLFEYIDSL
jgi:hypothetical protein